MNRHISVRALAAIATNTFTRAWDQWLICQPLHQLGQPAEDPRLAADYSCWLLLIEVLAQA